jgi:hypothetical protein
MYRIWKTVFLKNFGNSGGMGDKTTMLPMVGVKIFSATITSITYNIHIRHIFEAPSKGIFSNNPDRRFP